MHEAYYCTAQPLAWPDSEHTAKLLAFFFPAATQFRVRVLRTTAIAPSLLPAVMPQTTSQAPSSWH